MSAPPLWHRFDGPMNDASAATFNLLRELNVAAAPGTVAGYVTAHPAFPSLAAIVDALAEFGVRASARRISPEALASVSFPALVHFRDGSTTGAFWLVIDNSDGRFVCRSPDGEIHSLPEGELVARYLGIVVSGAVEPGAGERYAARNALGDRLRSRLPLAALSTFFVALAVSAAAACHAPRALLAPALGMSMTGFAGLGLTLYLSLRAHLRGSGILAMLCPTGRRFNCASVVGSEGAYVAGVVPLADVGAAFFLAQLAAGAVAALSGLFGAFLALFALFGVVLVPVIVHSLVQQAFVIRRWCPMCLLVDGVLAAELAVAVQAPLAGHPLLGVPAPRDAVSLLGAALGVMSPRDAVLLAGAAIVAALSYAVARPLVAPALAAPGLHVELESFRGAPGVLGAALARTPAVATDIPGKLVEGDAAAPIEILVVSHPFCVACADAHLAVRRLVEAFPRLVRAATVFSVSSADGAAGSAACRLLGGARDLGEWYARVNDNVKEWLRKPDARVLDPELAPTLAAQRAFAEREGIQGTPSIFVDGRRLPAGFALRHLRFYLRAEQRRLRAAESAARESA